MKKIINFMLMASLLVHTPAYAACDFSTGVTPGPNKTFIYSEDCHKQVGTLVQQNKIQAQQLTDLSKALTLKDLSIQESDKRATLWMNTSSSLETRLSKVDTLEKHQEWLYFGLGILTSVLAVWAASKVVSR